MSDDYLAACERAKALFAAYGKALQAQDPVSEQLAEEYRAALAEVHRLMPPADRAKVRTMVDGVHRCVAYSQALQRGDRAEMRRLYAAMTPEERAGIQHVHDAIDE
jgi:hypothetical protein